MHSAVDLLGVSVLLGVIQDTLDLALQLQGGVLLPHLLVQLAEGAVLPTDLVFVVLGAHFDQVLCVGLAFLTLFEHGGVDEHLDGGPLGRLGIEGGETGFEVTGDLVGVDDVATLPTLHAQT